MKKLLIGTAAVVSLLLVSAPGFSAECQGVKFPGSQEIGGQNLTLNGVGLREATRFMMGFDVYVGGLYLEEKTGNADEVVSPKTSKYILMKFVRGVDGSDITDAFKEGFKENTDNYGAIKKKVAQLNQWVTSIGEGETMAFHYAPKKGTTVFMNGTKKGTIEGGEFSKALFLQYIGPKPPNKELKRGLLGGKCN